MQLRSIRFTAVDGTALHARDIGPVDSPKPPLLCLAGLTRNSKDFEPLLAWLPLDRRVICPDYRGRGKSARAADPMTYTPQDELADQITLLDHLGIERAAVLGTSRGGIIAMLMAAFHRPRMAGILLNDIGPDIETAGLLRIRNNIDGPAPALHSWSDAIAHLKAREPGYETLSEAGWLAMAMRIFGERDGRPVIDFDPALVETFPTRETIEAGAVRDLWDVLPAMAGLPAAVLRGEHSDLLSARIVARMQAELPGLAATVVRNRGHIPLLDEPESIAAIQRWLAETDLAAG